MSTDQALRVSLRRQAPALRTRARARTSRLGARALRGARRDDTRDDRPLRQAQTLRAHHDVDPHPGRDGHRQGARGARDSRRQGDEAIVRDADVAYDRQRLATALRDDLKAVGVTRALLFEEEAPNVEPLRFHDLRSSFCTWARRAGRSDAWISERTGHELSGDPTVARRRSKTWPTPRSPTFRGPYPSSPRWPMPWRSRARCTLGCTFRCPKCRFWSPLLGQTGSQNR
jgi:hypothetical protein